MRGLMLLANGFEDVEALATRDVLLRGGVEVVTASINDDIFVLASHKLLVRADMLLKDANLEDYSFIILPGGGLGTRNLRASSMVKEAVLHFARLNMLTAAICAAPTVLGDVGLLHNKKYTCYPGCNEGVDGLYTASEIEVVDNIITARSMNYSVLFGLTILEKLTSKENALKIKNQIEGRE